VSTAAIVSVVNSVTTASKSRPIWRVITLVLGGAFGIVWSLTAAANPLTSAERDIAASIALQQPWTKPRLTNSSHRAVSKPHALSQQIVSVEKNVAKNAGNDHQARVYQFNYQTASARMLVVSLTTKSVIREAMIDSVHLPLNATESRAALASLAADPTAIELLRSEQIRRGQKPFSTLSELSVKSSIFSPIDPSHPCAFERCALLSLFDQRNTVFAVEPFVNLQLGTLGWLNR